MKNGITSPSFASASAITSLDLIGACITGLDLIHV